VTPSAPTTAPARPLRIASVPAAHPYVRHLGTRGVERLADPLPAGAPPGQWWPPVMVDPAWVARYARAFDVMHVHFGLESYAPRHLAATVDALRAAGRPLVYTVHDLSNPQLTGQAAHLAQLDVLVPRADALITLTPGAAAEIAERWGRDADVIAHPNLLPLDVVAPAGRGRDAVVVGVHLRDLRPNVNGVGTTRALVAAVEELRARGVDVVGRVELHERVRDDAARAEIRGLCATTTAVALRELPRSTDTELAAQLADLDVAVLPYAHGTHSGWLELCWDLGVAVVGPCTGSFAEQHDDPGSYTACEPASADSLEQALERLLREGLARPGSAARRDLQERRRAWRRAQREDVANAHLEVYRRVARHDPGW
jgi:glycosyltransferase involved in cell wall biosynthesis